MNRDKNKLKAIASQYMKEKHYAAATRYLETVLQVDPTDNEALYMMAAACLYINDIKATIMYGKKKLENDNKQYNMEVYMILAYSYNQQFNYKAANEILRRLVVEHEVPKNDANAMDDFVGTAYKMMADNYMLLGEVEAGKMAYLQATKLKSCIEEKADAFSYYLSSLNFDLSLSEEEIFSEHKKFQQFFNHVIPFKHAVRKESKKIKIGYISPDFQQHVMFFFYYPLLANYDKSKFQVTCYSLGQPDKYTGKLKGMVDCWKDVENKKDTEIADLIHADRIDILVDLAGHPHNKGLAAMAFKPAPIQVSGMGYFNTTGLDAIDYFFTDVYVDPQGKNDAFFVEKLVRLPQTHLCYVGRKDVPDPGITPCMKNHFVTFGSFNRIAKITDDMLSAWRDILLCLPDARFVFKDKILADEYTANGFKDRLQGLGFPLQRAEFRPACLTYMTEYLEIDIALDTFPYQGGGTTCDALYMGVPVISMVGQRHRDRFGYSILRNIGLEECLVEDLREYVETAVSLAKNYGKLDCLHKTLRQRMLESPLMDGKQYVVAIENAYQMMWYNFLSGRQIEKTDEADAAKSCEKLKFVANLHMKNKDYEKVIEAVSQLLIYNDTDHEAVYMASIAYKYIGQDEKGFELACKATESNRGFIKGYMEMALYYEKKNMTQELIAMLKKIVFLAKEKYQGQTENVFISEVWLKIANLSASLGSITESKRAYLKSSITNPDVRGKRKGYSGYLMATHYDLAMSDEQMLVAHRDYNKLFKGINCYSHNGMILKKKLRIGYISPDFRQHAVAFFSYHFLVNHNKTEFEVYCYNNGGVDHTTEQFKSFGSVWRDIKGMNESAVAKLIYEDKIDILVELAGHTANNCLPVLAYKPAPIQICGIGYFDTTGLAAVDYFLTDRYVDPEGQNDACFTEQLLRLPHSHWCYTKRLDALPCSETAYKKNRYITFCSFNNFAKVTDAMLCLWRKVLQAVPDSKLVLKGKVFDNSYGINLVSQRLVQLGFSLLQIEFRPLTSNYMQEYLEMDIALDTSPYTGGTTTCEALYMGIPVVTLVGQRHGARFGYSMLKNIGLEECIAYTEEEYVAKAVALAKDTERLSILHKGQLRQMMQQSQLMDGQRYMRDLEAGYKEIWHELVVGKSVDQQGYSTSMEETLYRIYRNEDLQQKNSILSRVKTEQLIGAVENLSLDVEAKTKLLNTIAVKFYEGKSFDHVIPLLSAALSLAPADAATLANLGTVLYNFGEKELAKRYLKQIRDPDEGIISLIQQC